MNEGKGKGMLQIIKQIDKLNEDPQYIQDEYRPKHSRLFIYPIIVYTDLAFSMPYVNDYLNKQFMGKLGEYKFFDICDFQLISSNFFMDNFDYFLNDPFNFRTLLISFYHRKALYKAIAKKTAKLDDVLHSVLSIEHTLEKKSQVSIIDEQILYKEIKGKLYDI
jgi:hypothetical protein